MKDFGRRALWEGMIAGAIGYAVVALFFVVVNLLQGRAAFHTAEALGLALFYGGAEAVGVGHAGPVIAYNGFHLVLFLVLGMAAAWLVAKSEQGPQFWYLASFALLFVVLHMLGVLVVSAGALGGGLSPVTVLGAGALAGVAMIYYLWRVHPRLRLAVRTYDDQPI